MPRHSNSSDYYESERDYKPRRRSGRVAEYEDVEIRTGRQEREPDFLRDDYERNTTGPIAVREEEVLEERGHGRRRPRREGDVREREFVEEEVIISKRDREKPRRREVVQEEEIMVRGGRESPRARDRGVERAEIREEVVYRPREHERRERSPPVLAREREEWHFGPRRKDDWDEEYDRDQEEVYTRREEREKPRERDYREEEIRIRVNEKEKERRRERDYREEDVTIRRDEREVGRPRERDYREEDITIRRGEREIRRPRDRDYREEDITIRRDEREGGRPRDSGYRREEISIRRDERETEPQERTYERNDVRVRETISRERSRPKLDTSFDREEVIIRRDERERPRDSTYSKEEIIIRKSEKEISPGPDPSPNVSPIVPYEPEPIRAPPIHQDIITHHRHINHGFEVQLPKSAPPQARSPSRQRSPSSRGIHEEIEIRRRSERDGNRYDDDVIIDRREVDRRQPRPRSTSPPRVRYRDDSSFEEVDYYARDRAFMGEGYNGATRDWAIVDVPPGANRAKMDGIGGASQEITWQRQNGVRRYVSQESKTNSMWTEITKDLVIKDAIVECGYDYEVTEFFYYIMEYLRYEDVVRLVNISERIKRERRERIRQMEWEQRMPDRSVTIDRVVEVEAPRRLLADRPYEEERVIEREIIYDRPPPPPRPREHERREVVETVYVRDRDRR